MSRLSIAASRVAERMAAVLPPSMASSFARAATRARWHSSHDAHPPTRVLSKSASCFAAFSLCSRRLMIIESGWGSRARSEPGGSSSA